MVVSLNHSVGLPPLARGAPPRRKELLDARRPTPAGAGSTAGEAALAMGREAYPRWRGEHASPAQSGGFCRWPTPAGAGSTRPSCCTSPGPRAYPRWRGEHASSTTRNTFRRGLPPLARGARALVTRGRVTSGPTPAGAGSTRCAMWAVVRCWAYPRWRGEHMLARVRLEPSRGLPPLARGAPGRGGAVAPSAGPTPAGAGSTTGEYAASIPPRAYPRWRGEHQNAEGGVRSYRGLPPLARGAPPWCSHANGIGGPTPAGAGSTSSGSSTPPSPRAYPRWRGEHSRCPKSTGRIPGLPPLARGALGGTPLLGDLHRPTPAGAGSTVCSRRELHGCKAYPRWRGEHAQLHDVAVQRPGLPPLARGARDRRGGVDVGGGPTPAGAGSTGRSSRRGRRWRAYPRWRGEHNIDLHALESICGLPPLARGARHMTGAWTDERRPTPAGAGSTT